MIWIFLVKERLWVGLSLSLTVKFEKILFLIFQVLMKTSVGDIDIELWSKETPKACRNFIQLCMEGYYDETIFHRIVKGFTSFFVFNFSNLFFTNLSMI